MKEESVLRVARFGVFEVDLRSGELRKSGVKVKLQEKPFEVLTMLLGAPGEIIGREQLHKELWPSDTFVDFDHNLNAAINRLREALGDSADNPRFVETLARRGYRFIAPVDGMGRAVLPEPKLLAPVGQWLHIHYKRIATVLLLCVGLSSLVGGAFLLGKYAERGRPKSFHQLTFQRGVIHSARFAPDGQTIVYSAAWGGKPIEVFATRREGPESRPLGLAGAEILAISSSGEMAVLLGSRNSDVFANVGTLARVPLAGGAPREVLEKVQWADWSPDGNHLAVVREVEGRSRLEFPIGKMLCDTAGWFSHPRVSPGGDLVAFLEHPLHWDDLGSVVVVDLAGQKRTLSSGWLTVYGLAWSPGGNEIWFTAAKMGRSRSLYAVSLSGRSRLVAQVPETLTLHDIWSDGRVLMTHDSLRREIFGLSPAENKERDLSWLDWSVPTDLSADGKTLLFFSSGEGGGPVPAVYLRKTDGSPPVRIGEGLGWGLSPDGKWVVSQNQGAPAQFVLLPTKAGEPRPLTHDALNHNMRVSWFPDGKRFLFSANEPGRGVRIYVQELAGGKPVAITPEGTNATAYSLSPDGKVVAAIGPDEKGYLFPVEGGQPRSIPGLEFKEVPVGWSSDSRYLYAYSLGELPAKVYRLDLWSGRRSLWEKLMPPDPAGLHLVHPVLLNSDGKTYVYGARRILSDLYLVEGLK